MNINSISNDYYHNVSIDAISLERLIAVIFTSPCRFTDITLEICSRLTAACTVAVATKNKRASCRPSDVKAILYEFWHAQRDDVGYDIMRVTSDLKIALSPIITMIPTTRLSAIQFYSILVKYGVSLSYAQDVLSNVWSGTSVIIHDPPNNLFEDLDNMGVCYIRQI